jgi:hypothetical protein
MTELWKPSDPITAKKLNAMQQKRRRKKSERRKFSLCVPINTEVKLPDGKMYSWNTAGVHQVKRRDWTGDIYVFAPFWVNMYIMLDEVKISYTYW